MKQYSHLRDAGARAAAASHSELSTPLQIPDLSLPFGLLSLDSPNAILKLGKDARTAAAKAGGDRARRRSSAAASQLPFQDVGTVDVHRETGLDLDQLRLQVG